MKKKTGKTEKNIGRGGGEESIKKAFCW